MPEYNAEDYNKELQQRMENLRLALKNLRERKRERFANSVPQENNEQEIVENIEEIPEEEVKVSWLNRPRGKSLGRPTNLSISSHVTLQDDGGSIN